MISTISDAASPEKNTTGFPVHKRAKAEPKPSRHEIFIENLSRQGYIFVADEKNLAQNISDLARNKIKTKQLNDNLILMEAARRVI